ncbi:MAG: hypothetical protein J7K00_02030 [Candidatus Diapherotrites archaeon]|nr:hypothetical protein [Candidatus Diapherotrites archaeon]
MHKTTSLKLDSKGRIIIPKDIRDSLGLTEDSTLMLSADFEKGIMELYAFPENARIERFSLKLSDVKGSLARVASEFSKQGIDLLKTESRFVLRENLAEWDVVADTSKCRRKAAGVLEELKKQGLLFSWETV